jgi:hypothetical protein
VAEALIRRGVEDCVKALRAKDIDGVMSIYAHPKSFHSISFRHCDTSGLTINVEPGKKPSLHRGPIAYEVRDLSVTTHSESAANANFSTNLGEIDYVGCTATTSAPP